MKKITKLFLLMLTIVLSSSLLFSQTQFEKDYNLAKQQQIKAAYVQTEFVTPTEPADGTMAQGDACTDPFDYGLVNDPPVNSATTFAGDIDWYEFTGTQDMTVTVSLCGSAFDTKLEVWNDCGDPGYAYYNDDACGVQSEITGIPFNAGDVMYVKVYGYGSSYGAYILDITGVPVPPPPSGVDVFPYLENFEDGIADDMLLTPGTYSGVDVQSWAANSSSYGLGLEGGSSSGWGATPSTYAAAFDPSKASHQPTSEIVILPDVGNPGQLHMKFDLMQGYSFNANYCWFRVLVDGNVIFDTDGNYYYKASTHTDPFVERVFDLTAFQGGASFTVTLQASVKYNEGYYQQGDIVKIDNFRVFSGLVNIPHFRFGKSKIYKK